MQSCRSENHRKLLKSRCLEAGCLLLVLGCSVPQARGQFALNREGGTRPTVAGSVMIDGEAQPAARVRVDVRAVTGGGIATTFTDSSGRFEAPATGTGAVIVAVDEQGYEPVEQRVDVGYSGGGPSVIITLRKAKPTPVERTGYTVSVHDLKVPGKARHEFEKGVERLHKNDAAGSLGHFKEATDAFPNYYEAYYQIGVANLELRRGNEAEQALQRSIDLSGGGYAEPQFALGALLCDRQSYPEAERVLRRAIDVDGNSWKGHLFLGQALFGQNRLADAEKSAREVLLRKPEVPSTYILLANIHIKRQEYILGIKDLDTFLNMKPKGPTSEQARAVRAAAQKIVTRLEHTVTVPQFVY
ncbi:MAG: von Willebrand factor, type [Candidatus Acidoferrum typicum]|nr:von Willebrand factor, type [Candidatus Acidoferrum typicum]